MDLYIFRKELVEKQMSKMPKYIEEYRMRLHKAQQEEERQQRIDKERLEEARDFYGYYVDIKSDRFKNFMANKQEAEKKMKKQLKKEQKAAQMA